MSNIRKLRKRGIALLSVSVSTLSTTISMQNLISKKNVPHLMHLASILRITN
jgi:hypothetical protein